MNKPEFKKGYMSNFKYDTVNNARFGIHDRKMISPKTTNKPKVNKTPGNSIQGISPAKSKKLKKENENKKKQYFHFTFFKWSF